jgi:hypothetical protein
MKALPCASIPNSVSPSESWVNWHKLLLKWFSKQEANQQWIRFWAQRAGAGTPADTHDLRDYMRSQGVDLTTDMSGQIRDKVENISDWIGDTFSGIRAIFLGAVILAIALIAYYMITNIKRGKQMSELTADLRNIGGSRRLPTNAPIDSGQIQFLGTQKMLR